MRIICTTWIFVILCLLFPTRADCLDRVHLTLKNNKELIGLVIHETDTFITIALEDGTELEINKDQIVIINRNYKPSSDENIVKQNNGTEKESKFDKWDKKFHDRSVTFCLGYSGVNPTRDAEDVLGYGFDASPSDFGISLIYRSRYWGFKIRSLLMHQKYMRLNYYDEYSFEFVEDEYSYSFGGLTLEALYPLNKDSWYLSPYGGLSIGYFIEQGEIENDISNEIIGHEKFKYDQFSIGAVLGFFSPYGLIDIEYILFPQNEGTTSGLFFNIAFRLYTGDY